MITAKKKKKKAEDDDDHYHHNDNNCWVGTGFCLCRESSSRIQAGKREQQRQQQSAWVADNRCGMRTMGSTWEAHMICFLSEPVAFRRVYSPESYSRTSGESNHHRQSVSDVKNAAIPTEPRERLNAFPILNEISTGVPTPPDSGKTPQLRTSKLVQNSGKTEILHFQPYRICWGHEIQTLPPM